MIILYLDLEELGKFLMSNILSNVNNKGSMYLAIVQTKLRLINYKYLSQNHILVFKLSVAAHTLTMCMSWSCFQ